MSCKSNSSSSLEPRNDVVGKASLWVIYCIISIEWSAHVTHYRGCSLTKVIILAPWLLHLPKTAWSAAENGNKRPFWHCSGVQKPRVTCSTYQIHSVQTCLLHVTEHSIEMIQYMIDILFRNTIVCVFKPPHVMAFPTHKNACIWQIWHLVHVHLWHCTPLGISPCHHTDRKKTVEVQLTSNFIHLTWILSIEIGMPSSWSLVWSQWKSKA